jgi:hypothetical protein
VPQNRPAHFDAAVGGLIQIQVPERAGADSGRTESRRLLTSKFEITCVATTIRPGNEARSGFDSRQLHEEDRYWRRYRRP